MKKIKTVWWFWIWIPFLLTIGLIYHDSTFDIPVHDTYYVIANIHVTYIYCAFLFLSGLGYIFIDKKQTSLLSTIHIISSLIGIVLFIFPFLLVGMIEQPRRYYSNTEFDFLNHVQDLNNVVGLGMGFIILGVITYFINLGIAIFKKVN